MEVDRGTAMTGISGGGVFEGSRGEGWGNTHCIRKALSSGPEDGHAKTGGEDASQGLEGSGRF